MPNINEIDKNFAVESNIDKENICWIDARNEQFVLKGVFYDNGCYKRMPDDVAKSVSQGVDFLHYHTSGGRLLFETDSSYVAISTKGKSDHMAHMAFTGSKGFDLYIYYDGYFEYFKTFVPNSKESDGFENIVEFGSRENRKIMIHFPLYGGVRELNIGLENDAVLEPFDPYKKGENIVYYGSSITQGGCASRPGNNFPAIVSRKTMTDFTCLGFSGNAHGEDEMADYIADLPMSIFVLDYDHNDFGDYEKLSVRHPKLYNKVRAKHPDIPIIILSAPWSKPSVPNPGAGSKKAVLETYEAAKKNGDNVYFVDGEKFFGTEFPDCATVDGCHPNDYGFAKMAEAVLKVIEENKLIK